MSSRSVVLTSRKVACPTCAAPRFEYCVGPDGASTERSHPARVAAARTAPTITPAQVETLRRLHLDPTRHIEPIVRLSLLRARLITSPDPPIGPQPGRRARKPKRRHLLTDAGREAIGVVVTTGEAQGAAS